MKYMQLSIKTDTADEMAKILLQLIPVVTTLELEYDVFYKDSDVDEEVRKIMAEHLSDKKFVPV